MLRWLQKEASCGEIAIYVITCVALCVFSSCLGVLIAEAFGLDASGSGTEDLTNHTFLNLLWTLPTAALIEEILFRVPLVALVMLKVRAGLIIFAALAISCLFGYLHGGYGHILIQGVSGLWLSLVFLKCGGFQEHDAKALFSSTTAHVLFNFTVFFLS